MDWRGLGVNPQQQAKIGLSPCIKRDRALTRTVLDKAYFRSFYTINWRRHGDVRLQADADASKGKGKDLSKGKTRRQR